MAEHDTQNAIIDLVRVRGGVATRVNSGGVIIKNEKRTYRVNGADKGTSDIIALYRGRYLAIEVKYGKNKTSPEQEVFGEDVKRAGGIFVVAWDVEAVERTLNDIDVQM